MAVFCPLYSGSSGNSVYLDGGESALLIDLQGDKDRHADGQYEKEGERDLEDQVKDPPKAVTVSQYGRNFHTSEKWESPPR